MNTSLTAMVGRMLLIYADGDDDWRRRQNETFGEAMAAAGNETVPASDGPGAQLFPLSGLALLYPLAAGTYLLTVGGSGGEAIAYGVANLGYVLLVAAVVSGTFKVFRLSKRWQVFLAAVVAWMLGTILSNVPPPIG